MTPIVAPEVPARTAAATVAAILLVVALAAALSVDVVKAGGGVKSDEATYVAMALSLAYDRDLTYERRDLERYVGLYRFGPEGIFLKRGTQGRFRDRLYFGKALIYPVVAAPFVRVLGLNGFLVLHVLLLFGVGACGYTFLAARSRPGSALAFTLAFVGASCVPVYLVFLAPEIFNFSLVFFAYFLWLYKEVAPPVGLRYLRGFGSDVCAAILLGAATYSKPSHALLIGPIVLWWWWRRRYSRGLILSVMFIATSAGLYGVNALTTGEFNYQGGDRKTFYNKFPFDGSSGDVWASAPEKSTNDSDAESVLQDFPNRFSHNVEYFLIGRHFGFVPYFFPGVVAIGLWLASRDRWQPWRVFTILAVVASAVGLLVFAPYTWSGGGGPPGNRYFMSVYPALFFLTPALTSVAPALFAWVGGALFTAKMLVNPFVAAKHPNETTERGFARRLPVELTMANDLPVALEGLRAHAWFSDVLLYFLDEHAYYPDVLDKEKGTQAIWIAGDGRADILMRSDWPIGHLTMTAQSPIRTQFFVSAGGAETSIPLFPGKPVTFDVTTSGVRDLHSYAYLLSARSTEGFTEHLRDPGSADYRNLGVQIRFTAVPSGR